MAAKTTRKPSKRAPLAKPKAKHRSKPLVAANAAVRRAKPASAPSIVVSHPPFPMFDMMGRVAAAYAELPVRLAQCRNPMDFWLIPAHMSRRIFSA